jgi:hypothetical protein
MRANLSSRHLSQYNVTIDWNHLGFSCHSDGCDYGIRMFLANSTRANFKVSFTDCYLVTSKYSGGLICLECCVLWSIQLSHTWNTRRNQVAFIELWHWIRRTVATLLFVSIRLSWDLWSPFMPTHPNKCQGLWSLWSTWQRILDIVQCNSSV